MTPAAAQGVLGAAAGAGIIIGAYFAVYSTAKIALRQHTNLQPGRGRGLDACADAVAEPDNQFSGWAGPHANCSKRTPLACLAGATAFCAGAIAATGSSVVKVTAPDCGLQAELLHTHYASLNRG